MGQAEGEVIGGIVGYCFFAIILVLLILGTYDKGTISQHKSFLPLDKDVVNSYFIPFFFVFSSIFIAMIAIGSSKIREENEENDDSVKQGVIGTSLWSITNLIFISVIYYLYNKSLNGKATEWENGWKSAYKTFGSITGLILFCAIIMIIVEARD